MLSPTGSNPQPADAAVSGRLRQVLADCLLRNASGQSAVEYIVVTAVLVTSLITLPSIYDTISHTMQDKYKSYAFSVAISDPPSKEFDDKVHHTADIIEQIENLLFDTIFPDIAKGKLPDVEDVKKFFDLVKSLF